MFLHFFFHLSTLNDLLWFLVTIDEALSKHTLPSPSPSHFFFYVLVFLFSHHQGLSFTLLSYLLLVLVSTANVITVNAPPVLGQSCLGGCSPSSFWVFSRWTPWNQYPLSSTMVRIVVGVPWPLKDSSVQLSSAQYKILPRTFFPQLYLVSIALVSHNILILLVGERVVFSWSD